MIDIHHHCLPGVDDGPRDWEESLELVRMAAAEGIETIVATPHVLRGRWNTTSTDTLRGLVDTLRSKIGDRPEVMLGSECFFNHDVAGALRAGTVIPLAGSSYVLIEFASHSIPPLVDQALYQLQLDGWTPVIAHPERNAVFQSRPELLMSLIRHGAKTQVTASSFTGAFGSKAEKAARNWLRQEMIHFVATDAHNIKRRPPALMAGVRVITEIAGERVMRSLTVENAQAMIGGKPLPYDPEPRVIPKEGILGRLGRWFGGKNTA
jgi:protein-tyrosine phosphatase